ncbi:hypothetical protein LIER_06126 [Lithospermum erythrorhizon]|uniref:Reverse transcriptase domain-containing protein n=1 Tax=Lithospermum erythrorhizon TaxID=34254 RepID=A0AAV3P3F3_LITER
METNLPNKPGVSTRAQNHVNDSRRISERHHRRDTGKVKVPIDHHRSDDESSHSNYAPRRQRGKTSYVSGDGDSSDSHTRRSNHRSGYDLTTTDITPERSPIRENRSRRQEKPIRNYERSLVKEYPRNYKDKHRSSDLRQGPSTRHDAGATLSYKNTWMNSDHFLKASPLIEGQLNTTLCCLFQSIKDATMPRGFRIPKFKTFNGFGDPNNHLKSFDWQLSFWASDDEYIKLEEVKLLFEEYSLKAEGSKARDEMRRKSQKSGLVWDRLQNPKEKGRHSKDKGRGPPEGKTEDSVKSKNTRCIPY